MSEVEDRADVPGRRLRSVELVDALPDRFLRDDELTAWLDGVAAAAPELVAVESYGRSHDGRDLLIVTVTETSTGSHDTKPAHWIDASIHAVELTATVAACRVIEYLVEGHAAGDERVRRALATRTFYIVPRVNPDGAEWALAATPRFRRSSTRPWPNDDHRWPGHHADDIDGDGRILQMRLADPDGPWTTHPDDERLLIPVPPDGVAPGGARYRLLTEGLIEEYDGFSIPKPRPPEGLDLNRNYPAGWGRTVPGAGDHPLSEPEIDALVRAFVARPNICGFNAFHTSGGFLLRPSSTKPDAKLPPDDVWVWKQLGEIGTRHTGYPVHSVYEDFTWDPNETMSGASDDWAYEHQGVFGWTTEFWDLIHAATGEKASTKIWYTGPTDEQALAVLRWVDEQPQPDDPRDATWVEWYEFDHPQLGPVELGGWNDLRSWTNPPPHLLAAEVEGHAEFAISQALAAPCLEIAHTVVERLGESAWRIDVGIVNTGWLPTYVSERAKSDGIVAPIEVELRGEVDATPASPLRQTAGQLAGTMAARFDQGRGGSPERTLVSFTVHADVGAEVKITVRHARAGRMTKTVTVA